MLKTELEKRLVKFNILKPRHEPQYKQKVTEDQEKLLLKVWTASQGGSGLQ